MKQEGQNYLHYLHRVKTAEHSVLLMNLIVQLSKSPFICGFLFCF